MKFTSISSTISIILLQTFTKLDFVQGSGPSSGAAVAEFGAPTYFNIKNDKVRRNRHRILATDEQSFMSDPEFEQCQEEQSYDTKLYFENGHLVFLAFPNNMNDSSNNLNNNNYCPIVAIDNGYENGDDTILVPHMSILHKVPEGGLSLRHSITLGSLSDALSNLDLDKYTIVIKDEYDILNNNCGTFLLALWDEIGFDYKDHEDHTNKESNTNVSTDIVNFVGDYGAKEKEAMDRVRNTYLEQNKGIFHQIKFDMWKYYVGDEEVARTLVRSYLNSMN